MNKNIEAERGLLSLMLSGNQKIIAKVATQINNDDLYQHKNKMLFEIISSMQDVDLQTVVTAIEQRGLTDDLGAAYVSELMGLAAASSSLDYYIKIILEDSGKRKYNAMSSHIQNMLTDGASTQEIKSYVEEQTILIAKHGDNKVIHDYKTVLTETMKEIQEKAETGVDTLGIKTGFNDLDYMLGGFQPGQMIVLAARPGMGKTALASSIAKNIAMSGKKVLFFSLEMTRREISYRDLASTAGIGLQTLKTAKLKQSSDENLDEWKKLNDAYGISIKAHLFIDDTGMEKIENIKSKARLQALSTGVDFIVIDHMQITTSAGKHNGAIELLNYISMNVKGMAKELEVPVLALSQLNRDCEKRADQRPQLSDLKGSGAIEQDADVVLFMYRDDYYNKENPQYTNQVEIDIAKGRDVKLGVVRLYCNLANMEFKNLERMNNF